MNTCAISVIIPTYRPQAWLFECLDALDRQTLPKERFEVIVALNGPADPYARQIEDYVATHPLMQLVFVQTCDQGASYARNLGLAHARGSYILFQDDDDYLSPVCLAEMLSLAGEQRMVICYPFAFEDGKPGIQSPYTMTDAYDACMATRNFTWKGPARRFFSGPCMKLIPASVIGNRLFDVRFHVGEDSIFMFLISDRIQEICFTSKQSIYYRRYRASSINRSQSFSNSVINGMRCMSEYTRIYFSGKYSLNLYVTRMLGACRRMLDRLVNNLK